jgi:hypothetical protein
MATGSLETDAGAELARALLDIDYDDFHGGTASRA